MSRRFDGFAPADSPTVRRRPIRMSGGVRGRVPVFAFFRELCFESAVELGELGALCRVHGWHAINTAPTAARPVCCHGGEGLLQEGTSCRRDLVQLAAVRTLRGFVLQRGVLLVRPDGGVIRNRLVQGAVTP